MKTDVIMMTTLEEILWSIASGGCTDSDIEKAKHKILALYKKKDDDIKHLKEKLTFYRRASRNIGMYP